MAISAPFAKCYESGQWAFFRGEPLDACKFRKIEKRNAWVRGWHDGQAVQAINTLTNEQRENGREQIAKLRELLELNENTHG